MTFSYIFVLIICELMKNYVFGLPCLPLCKIMETSLEKTSNIQHVDVFCNRNITKASIFDIYNRFDYSLSEDGNVKYQ